MLWTNYLYSYRFRKEWLTSGYSNKDTVLRDLRQKKLSENSAKALLGVHRRHESLADEPSELDMELLITIYKGIQHQLYFTHGYLCSLYA